jgi:protein-tyrosine phosphatase
MADAVALAQEAFAAGTHTLVATPHVNWDYLNDDATIARVVSELNAHLANHVTSDGGRVRILRGAEVASTRVTEIEPDELVRLGLGGGKWLLIEPPMTASISGLENVVADLHRRGHRVLLAHPERCHAFHRHPRVLASLVGSGVLTSITAGAFTGRFGSVVRRFALGLVEAGMIHNVASDFHDRASRPPGLASHIERAGLLPLSEWLTREVPAAILEGREIPRRPAVAVAVESPRRQPGWWKQMRTLRRVARSR